MKKSFAIIGCGRIAERHAAQIAKIGTLKAVCDIVREKADKLASLYNAKAYYSIVELLENETINVLSVCTPNFLHAEHALIALRANVNVLCEKPLCIHAADGKEMIDAALKAGKQLFVVKQNRYNPPVVFLKELIDSGKLGKIFSFQINCFWNRPEEYYTNWKGKKETDGGTLYTQFSHFIDLMYWMLGGVATVQSATGNFAHPAIQFEDTGMVIFTMQSGVIGSLNYTVSSFETNMEGSITVFGGKGTVKVGGQYLNELEYCHVAGIEKPLLPIGNPANGYGFYKGSMSNHDKVYENLLLALENPENGLANGEEGLKTVEIIEKIYNSIN